MPRYSYEPIGLDQLQVIAGVMGAQSAAALAVEDFIARFESRQFPACMQRRSSAGGGTYFVVDMRNPPTFLPKWLHQICAQVVAEIEADRHEAAAQNAENPRQPEGQRG